MFKAGADERRRIRMKGDDSSNRQAVELGELGLDQRCLRGIRMMHEPTGGVHVLADVVKPETGGVALETAIGGRAPISCPRDRTIPRPANACTAW